MLLDLFALLEYILGLQIIELIIRKKKEIFQWPIITESRIMRQGLFLIAQLVLPVSLIFLPSLLLCLVIEPSLYAWSKEL